MIVTLLLVQFALGGVAVATARHVGRLAIALAGLGPLAAAVWAGANAGRVLDGEVVTAQVSWVPSLGLDLTFRLDGFALLMLTLVAGIGTLVFAYAWAYFDTAPVKGGKVAGLLAAFAGAMFGLVLADDVFTLYACWELTSITSYFLIGIDDDQAEARTAARRALLITGMGGLAMLGGLVVLGFEAGTFRLSEIVAAPPSTTVAAVALVFVALGALTKSAQYPFHSWLPGAMVAPTPISAYLHSAAMVKAGVYLVARFSPAFATVGIWRPLIVGVGLFTMLAGGLRALRPFDLKQILAYGTISQLGFLLVLFGFGHPATTVAGCAVLLAHGAFKAALFMATGIIDHGTGTRDLRLLPTLDGRWRPTQIAIGVSAASMAAVPPLAGFVAKETAYAALYEGGTGERLVLAGIVAASMLTVAYSLRIVAAVWAPHLVRGTEPAPVAHGHDGHGHHGADHHGDDHHGHGVHAPGLLFALPALVLATVTFLGGLVPSAWSSLVDTGAHSLDHHAHAHLALWHGINGPLLLSLVTLVGGAALFAGRVRVSATLGRLAIPVDGVRGFDVVLHGVLDGCKRLTALTYTTSLPRVVGVILACTAAGGFVALASGDSPFGDLTWFGRLGQVPVATVLVTAALASAMVRRRFAAVVLLGISGYAMAAFFVVQGAPDLALTQFGVETLSVVVFLLVLRRMPDEFAPTPKTMDRWLRLVVSASMGVLVVVVGLAAAAARTEPSVSGAMVEQAGPVGHGRNIVNVILVDIRGIDTMGEITVLATAGIGVAALARAGRAPRRGSRSAATGASPTVAASSPTPTAPVATAPVAEPVRPSIIFDVTLRLVFDGALLLSLYLLFAGHNSPGGGFVGGLVAAAALALHYLAGGTERLHQVFPIRPWFLTAAGIVLAAGTAITPLLFGLAPMDQGVFDFDLPVIGAAHLTSATIFDTGVYLIVVGLVLLIFDGFAEEPPTRRATATAPSAPAAEVVR